jgi:hypothetical protein
VGEGEAINSKSLVSRLLCLDEVRSLCNVLLTVHHSISVQ